MLLNGIYAQLILIGLTMLWFGFSSRRSNLDSIIKTVAIVLTLLGLYLGGVWVYPPVYGLSLIHI